MKQNTNFDFICYLCDQPSVFSIRLVAYNSEFQNRGGKEFREMNLCYEHVQIFTNLLEKIEKEKNDSNKY